MEFLSFFSLEGLGISFLGVLSQLPLAHLFSIVAFLLSHVLCPCRILPYPPSFVLFCFVSLFVTNSFTIVFVAYWEWTKTNAYVQLDTIDQKYYLFFFSEIIKEHQLRVCRQEGKQFSAFKFAQGKTLKPFRGPSFHYWLLPQEKWKSVGDSVPCLPILEGTTYIFSPFTILC